MNRMQIGLCQSAAWSIWSSPDTCAKCEWRGKVEHAMDHGPAVNVPREPTVRVLAIAGGN